MSSSNRFRGLLRVAGMVGFAWLCALGCGDDGGGAEDQDASQSGSGGASAGRGGEGDAATADAGNAGDAGGAGSGGARDAGSRDASADAPDDDDASDGSAGTDAVVDAGDEPVATGEPLVIGVSNWGFRERSVDGATWSYCGNPSTGNSHSPDLLRAVGYGDGVFVAVGGDANSMVMRTFDGVHWEEDLYPPGEDWMGGVAYGDGVWLAGGGNGELIRSLDSGETWTEVSPQPRPSPIRHLTFGNGRFVAGTDGGALSVTDDDGETWTTHALSGGELRIAYGGGAFIAWGGGCFVGNAEATEWDPCPATVASGSKFVHDGTRWVAAIGGGYATSDDAIDWAEHTQSDVPSDLLFTGEGWVGRSGEQIFSATDLDDWLPVASGVPTVRGWTAGRLLETLPATSASACQDNR